jgi:hypothetical protein
MATVALFTVVGCNAPAPVEVGANVYPPPSQGGDIESFAASLSNVWHRSIALDGHHASASTLYLAAPELCATDVATFAFHGPIVTSPNGRSPEEAYRLLVNYKADIYRLRSPALAEWYVARYGTYGRPGNLSFTTFNRDQLNRQFGADISRC